MQSDRPPMRSEQFGPLQGVRIISSGTILAQPFAAGMAAEMGAEVIHIERPKLGDVWRSVEFGMPTESGGTIAAGWMQTQRNTYDITLDLSTPRGKEIFLQLVSQADIWMESSIPGTYKEWGLDDETVHKVNPKLVITHVSGYGQTGHPDYLARASYDMIGQAFGGLMNLTGFPDPEPPVRAAPWTGDFITALFCLWSSLAAYVYAQRTGQGQSIDLAQYEAIHHILAGTMVAYYELGLNRVRSGNAAGLMQPYDCFPAKDGWVVIATVGSVFDRVCRVIGLDPDEDDWRSAHTDLESIKGIEFNAILRGWIEDRTVKEVVDAMNAARVGCSAIMTPKDMAEDPHYEMRDMHIEWEDFNVGRKVKGVGITPKMSVTPGQIWRGSVPMGYDNDTVLGGLLGIEPAEIDSLREQGII